VIGAGLFVGSGAVTNQTGPAAILPTSRAGVLVVLIMRMLGEMAVANPHHQPHGARRLLPRGRHHGAVSGIVVVIFAFVGSEIVTIAAAESDETECAVAKATNAVIYRVLVFYVVAVFVVVAIVPWNDTQRALFC
jgi:L-asparagine transporter-like permease